jgi:2TM domain
MTVEKPHDHTSPDDAELRKRAVERLEKKSGFWAHLLMYVAVNTFLVAIWAWNDSPVFWPIFGDHRLGDRSRLQRLGRLPTRPQDRGAHPARDGPAAA